QRAGCHHDRFGCRRGAAVNLEGTKCRRGAFALGEAETEEETRADNVEPVPEDHSSFTSPLAMPPPGAINASKSRPRANRSQCFRIWTRNSSNDAFLRSAGSTGSLLSLTALSR